MHGLTTIYRLNQENREAARTMNARNSAAPAPVLQGYGKGATAQAEPVILNASTGLTQEEAEGRN